MWCVQWYTKNNNENVINFLSILVKIGLKRISISDKLFKYAGVAEWQTRKIKDLVINYDRGSSSLLARIKKVDSLGKSSHDNMTDSVISVVRSFFCFQLFFLEE